MKTNLFLITILFNVFAMWGNIKSQDNSFVDGRDGKEYKILYIGNQIWMGQNLDFEAPGSWAYGDKIRNAKRYGRFT
jgi:hypothetical protein